MKKQLSGVKLCLFLTLLAGLNAYGQVPASAPPTFPFCATPDLSRAQALDLIRQGQQAYQQKINSGGAFQSVTYVPIRPHILRRNDGSGGMSLDAINQVIAVTNRYYLLNGAGIQFFFSGTAPDYIDNDQQFNSFDDENAVANGRDATNAMNQYYVNSFSSGAGGYAYYPFDDLRSTRSFILNELYNTDDMGNRLIPHELGHNFNLVHTFGQRSGNGTLGSGTTLELVTRGSGANCTFEGDYICDTPADPYNVTGAYLTYQNNCPIYDPTSPARDANGDAYSPSVSNIMSYYFPCTHDFTPGQYDRMQQALALRQSHTSYTLNAPPTNAAAPGNLTGNFTNGNVVLNWQDNASNEMGYFIERSTSPNSGFLPIGGVGPNGTTFTDPNVTITTTYYYRIRPSNSTTGNVSPTLTVQMNIPLLTGLRTTNISANAVNINWDYPGNGYTYDIQWRPVGTTPWNTIAGWTSTTYTLSGLTLGVAYEWQVKITGGSTYAGPLTFTTTTCPVPVPYTPSPGPTSVSLYWEYASPPRTYTLQFRQQNTTPWTTVEGISSPYYQLTGLTTHTPYDWRVRATCGGSTTIVTDYSPVQSFTTLACPVPVLALVSYNSSSVSVNWSVSVYGLNNTYTLRHRPVGTTSWTRVESLTTTTYSVTGLTANVSYEIQAETNCSATEQSGFSASLLTTPTCLSAVYLYSSAKASTAQLVWYTTYNVEPGTTFGVQYRPAGSATWSSVISVPVANLSKGIYSLTGLAANTTYEWRVQTNCTAGVQSVYSMGANFTTTCSVPTNLNAYSVSTTSAGLGWNAGVETGTLFEVRYRVVGAANWTTVSSLSLTDYSTSFVYQLTGLTNNVTYEWQVRTLCSSTDNSGFSAGPNFATSCQTPGNPYTYNLTVSSALLSWGQTGAAGYELRYRKQGTVNYTNVSSLTASSLSLTGLATGTTYEWQVRSQCDGNVLSDFSTLATFSTYACQTPVALYTSERTGTSARLNWYYYYGNSDTRYEMHYRPVGANLWTTVSSLTITTTNGSYLATGLTPDVQYEWQIRTFCTDTDSSPFSALVLFTTCSQMYTTRSGFWTDASIWSCNRLPNAADTVQIKHQVQVPYNYTISAGTLRFDVGQQLIVQPGLKLMLGQ